MRRNLVMLVGLALLWGASFMFIKIADRQLAPSTLILGRLGLAALTLAVIVPFTVGWRETFALTRANWYWLLVVALLNTAAPFWLLAWGETRIASGLASIIQGAVPVFNALFALAFFREVRVTGLRLVGFALGFVGVALIVGGQPSGRVLGALAVVAMALCYALGGLFMGRHLRGGLADRDCTHLHLDRGDGGSAGGGCAGAAHLARLAASRFGRRPRRPAARSRLPALLRPDHRPRRGVRLARGVPHTPD